MISDVPTELVEVGAEVGCDLAERFNDILGLGVGVDVGLRHGDGMGMLLFGFWSVLVGISILMSMCRRLMLTERLYIERLRGSR